MTKPEVESEWFTSTPQICLNLRQCGGKKPASEVHPGCKVLIQTGKADASVRGWDSGHLWGWGTTRAVIVRAGGRWDSGAGVLCFWMRVLNCVQFSKIHLAGHFAREHLFGA